MWQIIASVASVIVPVATVLWYCIRAEMRAQVLALHLTMTERVNGVDQRVTAITERANGMDARVTRLEQRRGAA
jgi:hypothetical protein